MSLTLDQVKKVAKLANLELSATEERLFAQQLSSFLEYVEKLESAEVGGVEPLFNPDDYISQLYYEDKPAESLTQAQALNNAKVVESGQFVVKGRVIDD